MREGGREEHKEKLGPWGHMQGKGIRAADFVSEEAQQCITYHSSHPIRLLLSVLSCNTPSCIPPQPSHAHTCVAFRSKNGTLMESPLPSLVHVTTEGSIVGSSRRYTSGPAAKAALKAFMVSGLVSGEESASPQFRPEPVGAMM